MSPFAAADSTTSNERLRALYMRREQLAKAIAALEELAELRLVKAPVIEIDTLRSLSQAYQ
jgi:hypothetical protein